MNKYKIAILLSTYNGENYIRDQIDSIINQKYSNWILYIRDDGSSDNTVNIILSYQKNYPNIYLFANDSINLGPLKSFLYLMENVQHDYYMFCDQDDVWLPNKIELTLNEMIILKDSNKIAPLLVFSDLIIVNHKLEIISTSLWNYWNISCIMYPEKYLYATPLITGCTMMFNHKAKIVSLKYSKKAIMHDSLIALSVLSNSGKIKAINESLIFYRQHDNNVLGALSVNNTFLFKLKNIKYLFKSNFEYYCFSNYITSVSFFKFILLRIEIIVKRNGFL